jgi:hypothetical protein
MQRAIREVEIQRNKLLREVQGLRGTSAEDATRINETLATTSEDRCNEVKGAFDPSSPLLKELQLYPWPPRYKPHIPIYDEKSNPRIAKLFATKR